MKKYSVLLLAILLSTQAALACKCRMIEVSEGFANSELVVSGTVTKSALIKYVIDKETGQTETVRKHTITVSKVYKGQKAKTFYVYSSTNSASCGIKLTKGKKYVVYANKNTESQAPQVQGKYAYWTTTCHRTRLFSAEEVTELKKLL